MRRGPAGRVDQNHAAIVHALRQAGASVQSLASVGSGCPDLLVGLRGRNYLVEVKRPTGVLTADQVRWIADWRGPLAVVHSVDQAFAVLGLARSGGAA